MGRCPSSPDVIHQVGKAVESSRIYEPLKEYFITSTSPAEDQRTRPLLHEVGLRNKISSELLRETQRLRGARFVGDPMLIEQPL